MARTVAQEGREMNSLAYTPTHPRVAIRHRANPLFVLPGLLLIIIGIIVMVGGFGWAVLAITGIEPPQPEDLGRPPDAAGTFGPVMDGFAVCIIGCTVMTVGRYVLRGARRRGWRDRLGRFLIIMGYLDIGLSFVVLTRFIGAAMGAEGTGADDAFRGLLICLAIAVPGVVLTGSGFRLAKEEPLMIAEANASF